MKILAPRPITIAITTTITITIAIAFAITIRITITIAYSLPLLEMALILKFNIILFQQLPTQDVNLTSSPQNVYKPRSKKTGDGCKD